MAKQRVDQMLVARGLAETRSRAQALIMAGAVFSTLMPRQCNALQSIVRSPRCQLKMHRLPPLRIKRTDRSNAG